MTPGTIEPALRGAGLPAWEIAGKAALYGQVVRAATALSARLDGAWWVPGRLEVFGTHTDYAGGRALVCAVPRGLFVTVCARADDVVRVVDAASGEQLVVDVRRRRAARRGWRRYVAAVVARLARNFPDAALGADLAFGSDLPPASGMSSSSALVVGTATALVERGALRDRPEWRGSIRDRLDEATYYSCLENGLGFRHLAGDLGVGTHGGSEDHVALLCSTPGAVRAFGFVPVTTLGVARLPEGWQFVVCSSGVRAEKTGAARDAYNRLADRVTALLALWNESGEPAASLGTVADMPEAVDRLRELVRRRPRAGAAPLLSRLEHFLGEHARVPAALDAFRSGDATLLGELAATSQRDAERLLENQIEATASLARCAILEGAFAARSFGAGFGGSVWAAVDATAAASFADRWLGRYRRDVSAADQAVAFLAPPGPAVLDLGTGTE